MKYKALFYKDFLLLVRDFWGLLLLFLMPWALVLLMTYLQDSTFRSVNENNISLYLLDNDCDSLGSMISRQLAESSMFHVYTSDNGGKSLNDSEVEASVSRGDYMIGIVIPANSTTRLRGYVRKNVEEAFNGATSDSVKQSIAPLEIKILIDPTTKSSFRATIAASIRENAAKIQNKLLLSEVERQVNQLVPVSVNLDFDNEIVSVNEQYAKSDNAKIIPNSTQHNVPAWSMFAIFFIVISLAGNMIRERELGCFNRLMTMPCSFTSYIFSKIGVYLCVCLLQLSLMIVTGMFITPLFGLPALKIGHSIGALVIMSVSASLAAIGYGLAIGSIARTNQQASIFGAVSVVILAAIGGVWVPTFLMPRFMQIMSHISPLNWGLNGFNEIFVRDAGFVSVFPFAGVLFLFFIVCLLISYKKQ